MNLIERFGLQSLVEAIGWTLLHFVWQGAAVAVLVAVTLLLMRRRSANARYVVACIGMVAMLTAPAVTLAVLLGRGGETAGAMPWANAFPADGPTLGGRIDALAPALTILWAIGTFAFQLRYLGCWLGAQRLRSHATRPLSPDLERSFLALCVPLAVRREVRMLQTSLGCVPMVIGWLRPVILLPVAVLDGLTPPQLRAVVAHELAHVRRHDYLVNLLQAGFESLLFYHPAVWWLSGRIRVEREYCCDDLAARVCGDTIAYARALALLDELRAESCAPALAATGGSLMHRISRLLGVHTSIRTTYRAGTAAWLTPAALSGALIAGVSAVGIAAPDLVDDDVHRHVERRVREMEIHAHEEHDAHERVAHEWEGPFEAIDIVEIVRGVDAGQAEVLALLRDAGFDNKELTALLHHLGTDRRILGDIERELAVRMEIDALEARTAGAEKKLQAAVEAGKMTEAEARARMHYVRAENEETRARIRAEREQEAAMHRRIIEMEARGMTREEIDREIRPERLRRRARQADRAREDAERKLDELRKHLDEAMAVGKVTPEKARAYMAEMKAKVERDVHRVIEANERQIRIEAAVDDMRSRGMSDEAIHEALRERGIGPGKRRPADADADAIKARLHEMKLHLADAVNAGRLTEDEAKAHLEKLHEELAARRGPRREARERAEAEHGAARARLDHAIARLRDRLEAAEANGASPDELRKQIAELRTMLEKLREEDE